jgi:hypothetical protein
LPAVTARGVRACLGGLWLIDAALQAQPHFFGTDWWHNDLAESVMGQPEPVSRSILWATGHLAAHAISANILVIAIQAVIGLALVLGRFERAAIVASIPWSLGVWWIGEGFGALPTGFALLAAGAPGPVLLYPLIGLLAWPAAGHEGDCAIPKRSAIACWAAVWVGGAILALPWRFPAARMLQANIEQNGLGQPAWIAHVSHFAYELVGSHPLLLPAVLFVVQVGIGAGAIAQSTRRYSLAAGVALAHVFWVTVQALGGLASGAATDTGPVPLLVLLALAVCSSTRSSAMRPQGGVRSRRPATMPSRWSARLEPAACAIQSGASTEYWACTSTSRTTSPEPGGSASTT